MSYSLVTYASTGTEKVYAIPFPYLDKDHIQVYLDGVLQDASKYTFPTSATLEITAQPAAGVIVLIKRITNVDTRLVDFTSGATITEADLDLNSNQLFYLMQETIDSNVNSWISAAALESVISAQATCLGYVSDCQDEVDNCEEQVTLAAAQVDLAKLWAEEAEDTPVETGKYSAKHWAAKAAASAAGALQAVVTGAVLDFAGGTIPAGYLECNGQTVSRETYADLFAAIGTLWGDGDGSTTFEVPNLGGSFCMGDNGDDLTLGDVGGADEATLTESELPAHTHTVNVANGGVHNHTFLYDNALGHSTPTGMANAGSVKCKYTYSGMSQHAGHTHTATCLTKGSGNAFSILPPYAVMKKIIKT